MLPPSPSHTRPRRPSLNIPLSSSHSFSNIAEIYSDARTHGYKGPSRTVRLSRAIPSGDGALSKSEDGTRCVVAGRECEYQTYAKCIGSRLYELEKVCASSECQILRPLFHRSIKPRSAMAATESTLGRTYGRAILSR